MSHDRGCPCGRERWEYQECDRGDNCYKWDHPDCQKTAIGKYFKETPPASEVSASVELTYDQEMARLKILLTDVLNILERNHARHEHDLISSINVYMLKLDERILTTLTEDEIKMIMQHRLTNN